MANNEDNINEYLQADQQATQSQAEDPGPQSNILEEEISDEQKIAKGSSSPKRYSGSFSRLHFWSDWSKNKKIYVFGGGAIGLIIFALLTLFFVIRPNKTNSYLKSSWFNVVSSSSNIDRAIKSDVNLEGTRDLTRELYIYNEKLGATSFDAKSKNSIVYKNSVTDEYGELTKSMGEYFSDSAVILAKTDSDISAISETELSDLNTEGSELKAKVDDFRIKEKLEEDLNPDIFNLDDYILNVKSKKEEIEKEKKEEEQKKKDEENAAAAKDAADKKSVDAVGNSYFKAFINGSETGVRATLSKGYQDEYDFAALSPIRRASLYPKSYRIVSVSKDGENYKLSASVTYISVYQDGEGNSVESPYTANELFRVLYSTETGSWKLDGRVDS